VIATAGLLAVLDDQLVLRHELVLLGLWLLIGACRVVLGLDSVLGDDLVGRLRRTRVLLVPRLRRRRDPGL